MSPSTLRKSLRALVLASFAGAAGAAGTAKIRPTGPLAGPLAADLEASTGLEIEAPVAYEDGRAPSMLDAVVGRRVIFAARIAPDAPRDIYRATVRATPSGSVLAVGSVANLTDTSLGDDGPLVVDGHRVAFVTRAFGVIQSAAVLDFGDRSARSPGLAGVRRALTDLQTTGALRAPARWDLRLDRPVHDLSLTLSGATLTARGEGHTWTVDTARGEVMPTVGATLNRQEAVDKPAVLWAVDTVRALPWVGPTPITWLEARVFGARDWAHRLAYRWWGHTPTAVADASPPPEEPGEAALLTTGATGDTEHDPWWPPPAVRPSLEDTERGEGVWVAAGPSWMRRLPDAPPAFYRTFLRLDRERPYARVVLAAMDLRQLELGMQAGTEDPVPLVGPRGDGRIPRTPGLMPRVVAAFNGAFKTEHGAYGMTVNHRVLLPPQPHAATVAVLDDGRVAMGTWGDSEDIPPGIASLRQNLDPLVADGVVNPTHRAQWGFVIGGIESMPTVRSGLCNDGHGHLIYAWGEETTARTLARAMHLAGCTYGMHLDMNPSHAVFHFLHVEDLASHHLQYQELASGMQSGGDRFVYYTLKDFFYLAVRDYAPPPVGALPWTPAPASAQPSPRWMPGVFTMDLPVEGTRAVRLTSFALDRVGFRVAAGRAETLPGHPTPPPTDDGSTVIGALELGVAPPNTPRGLMTAGRVVMPFAPGSGHVALDPAAHGISVAPDGLPPAEARDALQGTALLREGALMIPLDGTPRPLAAMAITADRRVILAQGNVSPREIAMALRQAGAREAVTVDRGVGVPQWHATDDGVRAVYPGTTLYVLAREAPSPVVPLSSVAPDARNP